MKLFVQPNDVAFFRDGRPFDAGGDHVARLTFPPNPLTFYGAIRAALIAQQGASFEKFRKGGHSKELKDVVGDGEKAGSLEIVDFGIALAKGDEGLVRLFPIPLDIVKEKTSDDIHSRYFVLSPERNHDEVIVNFPHKSLVPLGNSQTEGKFLTEPSGFLNGEALEAYLSDREIIASHFYKKESVFKPEYRVGIERNTRSHTAEEGQLYSVEFARLEENAGFAVELDKLNGMDRVFINSKFPLLRLGGEARSARYSTTDWSKPTPMPAANGRFKLVFLTPAVFGSGWIPDGIDPTTLGGAICKCEAKLVAAAVGRPIGIGGWDILKNDSKPTRRAVPAGSVYFFEATADRKFPELEPNGFVHVGSSDFTRQGLGQAIITSWNYIGD